jgi:hypothetical protein
MSSKTPIQWKKDKHGTHFVGSDTVNLQVDHFPHSRYPAPYMWRVNPGRGFIGCRTWGYTKDLRSAKRKAANAATEFLKKTLESTWPAETDETAWLHKGLWVARVRHPAVGIFLEVTYSHFMMRSVYEKVMKSVEAARRAAVKFIDRRIKAEMKAISNLAV